VAKIFYSFHLETTSRTCGGETEEELYGLKRRTTTTVASALRSHSVSVEAGWRGLLGGVEVMRASSPPHHGAIPLKTRAASARSGAQYAFHAKARLATLAASSWLFRLLAARRRRLREHLKRGCFGLKA